MKNTDYKFKPFRGTQRAQSPSYRQSRDIDQATQDEQKHLQKKVQELVWFFQNGSKPRHTKKNSTNTINKSPTKSHGLQTQATSSSSIYQSQPSKRNLNTLKAAIGRSAKSPSRIFKIPPSRSNEQLSLNSGQISSRQANKRAVGSMTHSSTSQTLHSGSASRSRKNETPLKKKVHHFSQHSGQSQDQQYYDDSSFERNEQESKREEDESRHRPFVEERPRRVSETRRNSRSPLRKIKVDIKEGLLHSSSLAQQRSRQADSDHHTFGTHQHNNTVDEASLKAALGGREDRHTPLKGRQSLMAKSRKSVIQAESVLKSRSNSGAGSRRSSMSPNRSQMLHFALFKDQANVKYGCVPVSDESMNYPSKAFKTFISSMAQDGSQYEERQGGASRVSEHVSDVDAVADGRIVKLKPHLDQEIEEPGQIEAPMPMSPPMKFQDQKCKEKETGISYEGYFHTERAQRAMEMFEANPDDSGEAIENILQKHQSENNRIAPYPAEREIEIHTSAKDFLPTPIKERRSPDQGGSTRRSDVYGATPATAADETAALEREHDQEELSPMRSHFYEEPESRSSTKKKGKPTSFCFSRGGGSNFKTRMTGDVIQESARESEALQSPPPQYQEREMEPEGRRTGEVQRVIRTEGSEESQMEYERERRLTKKKSPFFKEEEELQRRKKQGTLMESEGLDLLASGGLDQEVYGLARLDSKDRMKLGSIASSQGSDLRLGYKKKSEDVYSFGSIVGAESVPQLKSQQTFGKDEETGERRTTLRESPNFLKERNNKTPLRQPFGLDSARDSVLTEKVGRIPTFSNIEGLDIAPEKRERWSQESMTKFQELRSKLGSPQATLALFNAIQKEGATLIQRQFRVHRLRKTIFDGLAEVHGLISLSKPRSQNPLRVHDLKELPFINTGVQTETVPELALFRWLKEGSGEKEKARRTGLYALALAMLSFRKVMQS